MILKDLQKKKITQSWKPYVLFVNCSIFFNVFEKKKKKKLFLSETEKKHV